VGLDARPEDPLHARGSGTWPRPPRSGSTATTRCTTRTPTSSARTTTSATASCASTRTRPGRRFHLGQPIWNFINAVFFEYGIAAYDLDLGAVIPKEQTQGPGVQAPAPSRCSPRSGSRPPRTTSSTRPVDPDRLVPADPGGQRHRQRRAQPVVHSIILCGHFPEGVETFEKTLDRGRDPGEWYLRQMLGSANISGSKALHLMSGNLSHQIEHHLFPDLPSNRYAEIAPKVEALFEKYGLTYLARPLVPQVYSAPGTRSSGSRCPTAGSRPPTPRTPRSSSASSTRWPPVTAARAACWAASSRASPARPPDEVVWTESVVVRMYHGGPSHILGCRSTISGEGQSAPRIRRGRPDDSHRFR
jgi:hypothetical protein